MFDRGEGLTDGRELAKTLTWLLNLKITVS